MDEPQRPERLQRPPPPSALANEQAPARSSVGVTLALGVAVMIVLALSTVVTLALGAPPLAAAIAIGGGVFALAGLQYLLWGWWLGPKLRRQAEEESK
jgi:hypothetical protein